jgi:hypothetical protein
MSNHHSLNPGLVSLKIDNLWPTRFASSTKAREFRRLQFQIIFWNLSSFSYF